MSTWITHRKGVQPPQDTLYVIEWNTGHREFRPADGIADRPDRDHPNQFGQYVVRVRPATMSEIRNWQPEANE